jgi:hypothetical protein
MKPTVHDQGKIIAQEDDGGFLVMFPTGDIVGASTRAKALRKIKAWCSENQHGDAVNFATVEWRLA